MEKRSTFSEKLLLTAIMMQLVLVIPVGGNSNEDDKVTPTSDGWSWSSWSGWTPCSRTCGGGVSLQRRQCLPRYIANSTTQAAPSLSQDYSRARQVRRAADCTGSSRRYHECNTQPCSSESQRDVRAEQCASYDRRPFRGRFYNWIPYIEGDSQCTLNCRPMGKQFYASLGLVADGTPCTKPGHRAICIQGDCKIVGREGVLSSSSSVEVRCGKRLVSGLFSRPRLPLGYSYVTTVPRGACKLNVSEQHASENYIALKLSNGSYIMNGEFAVSSPGAYDAAGTRFIYTRTNNLDAVFAYGPLLYPIDIMILYTVPSPLIKYEYYTENLPGDDEYVADAKGIKPESSTVLTTSLIPIKHYRRHHSFKVHPKNSIYFDKLPKDIELDGLETNVPSDSGNVVPAKKYTWKILTFAPCTRSCGGGIQVGKYRCLETSSEGVEREVTPMYCNGSPPLNKKRRCGAVPCPPRWRTTSWSLCPVCGPANRTRIVGCVQDNAKGIAKVSDTKCPDPKPPSEDPCEIRNCSTNKMPSYQLPKENGKVIDKRLYPHREEVEAFRDEPVYKVMINDTVSDGDIGPEYTFSSGGWLNTEWSQCVGWCVGGGIQTRGVRCADPSGCAPRRSPDLTRTCMPDMPCEPYEGTWFTGDWSECSSNCGGKQIRGVLCVGGTGRHLRDYACKAPRPEHERDCGTECSATWYFSDWSQCKGNCDQALQRRTVWCARNDGAMAIEIDCLEPKPDAQKDCKLENCQSVAPKEPANQMSSDSTRMPRMDSQDEKPPPKRKHIMPVLDEDCQDKLTNCALALQARLCHYKYYTQNCCRSCTSS